MDVSRSQDNISEKVCKQLKNIPKWEKIEHTTNGGQNYIIGEEKNQSPRYFYAIGSKNKFTFKTLKDVIEKSEQDSLTLAIQDADSTTVYYKTRVGLNPPVATDVLPNT